MSESTEEKKKIFVDDEYDRLRALVKRSWGSWGSHISGMFIGKNFKLLVEDLVVKKKTKTFLKRGQWPKCGVGG